MQLSSGSVRVLGREVTCEKLLRASLEMSVEPDKAKRSSGRGVTFIEDATLALLAAEIGVSVSRHVSTWVSWGGLVGCVPNGAW